MPNSKDLSQVQDAPGENLNSYTSPGDELGLPGTEPKVKGPNVNQQLDMSHFINSAILLADYTGSSYEESVKTLLVAKAGNPAFDLGALAGLSGKNAKMAENLQRAKPLIQEAMANSLEAKIQKLIGALEVVKEQFEAKDGWVFPVATMAKHAIVVNNDGNVFRAHFEESEDGVTITKAEKYNLETKQESITKVTSRAVDALMEGRKAAVKVGLRDLLKQRTENDSFEFAKARHQSFLRQIKESSFWKEHIKDNAARIKVFVRGQLSEINNSGIRARFGKMRMSEMDSRFVAQYQPTVRKALSEMLNRFMKMRETVSEAFTKDQWLINSLGSMNRESGHSTAHFMNYFVGEYLNSLTSTVDGIRLALGESDLPFQALLYDTLAEEYPAYALAYLFTKKALSDIRSGLSQ